MPNLDRSLFNRGLSSGDPVSTLHAASRTGVNLGPHYVPRRFHNTYSANPRISKAYYIVGGTIAACVGMYGYTIYTVEQARRYRNYGARRWITDNFTCSLRNFREGRYWTLLSCSLMHANLPHLALNMLGLYSFGPLVIVRYGVPAFIALWIGAGLTGSFCELYFTKDKPGVERYCVGASGSILGIVVANACAAPQAKMLVFPIPFPLYNWVACLGFAAYSVYAQGNGLGGNTGHLGHLGGMVFGAVYWLTALRGRSVLRRPPGL